MNEVVAALVHLHHAFAGVAIKKPAAIELEDRDFETLKAMAMREFAVVKVEAWAVDRHTFELMGIEFRRRRL